MIVACVPKVREEIKKQTKKLQAKLEAEIAEHTEDKCFELPLSGVSSSSLQLRMAKWGARDDSLTLTGKISGARYEVDKEYEETLADTASN